jgi:Arc/MetJ family transcription regulator
MTQRTTVELDPDVLAEVRAILGTSGIRDTIDAAFDRIVRQAKREALLKRLQTGDGIDLGEDIFRQSRPRTP